MRRHSLLVATTLAVFAAVAPASSAASDPCVHPKPTFTTAAVGQQPVNDPFFTRQWGLAQINVPAVWARGARGAGVVIAVIDSGMDRTHPEFAGKIVPGGRDTVGPADGGCPGPEDENGHGTYVAGIAAALTDNGRGGAGVAPDAVILPERVVDADGVYEDADLAEGVDAAVDAHVNVINLSLGSGTSQTLAGPQLAPAVEASVARAVDAGIVVVAAAGNLSQPLCAYPASVRGVICVAATDRDERPSFYSNLPSDPDGSSVDGTTPVRAPGGAATEVEDPCSQEAVDTPVDVLSTTMPGAPLDFCKTLLGYEATAGTSAAAPFVAGVAALLLSAGLDAKAVRACLRTTSRDPTTGARGTFTPAYGYGIVDAEAALQTCAPGFSPTQPTAPSPPAHQQPQPADSGAPPVRAALPAFARRPLVRRDRRGLTIALRCASRAACAGVLAVRAGRRIVARSSVGVPAGRNIAVRLRWRGRAPQAKRLRATLANDRAAVRVTLRAR